MEGRKTDTRRVVKPQAWSYANDALGQPVLYPRSGPEDFGNASRPIRCPYGQPGDLLWVRETWGTVRMHELGQHVFGDGPIPDRDRVVYRAGRLVRHSDDAPEDFDHQKWPTRWSDDRTPDDGRWRPSIHMPKKHARIWLEVTEVRVERVQDIGWRAVLAEGVEVPHCGTPTWGLLDDEGKDALARPAFARLWDSINGKSYPWSSDPWVWVVAFRVPPDSVPERVPESEDRGTPERTP